jgi:hypothetical protein
VYSNFDRTKVEYNVLKTAGLVKFLQCLVIKPKIIEDFLTVCSNCLLYVRAKSYIMYYYNYMYILCVCYFVFVYKKT